MMRFFNTLTRRKDELKPIHQDWVGLYTCGPTVYHYAHIGNLRTYIFEDILERTLRYNGHDVHRVMNVTDVGHLTGDTDAGEDKMEKAAQAEKRSPEEIARFYTEAFLADLKKLNILIPDIIAPATAHIREEIALIETLFEKGYAYDTPNAVYFDVSKFKDYGKLSGQSLSEKMTGAREDVVVDKDKRNDADFALWFKLEGKFKHHLLHWPSPWGEGFPGWHVECSAISRHFLGQPFDIHTGGVDHIGTHHTNEIAQSEAAFDAPLAHIWMHGEHLTLGDAKMAKSEGNILTLTELEGKGYHPLIFRYLVLGAHYRTRLSFTMESLDAAKNGLENLYQNIFVLAEEARAAKSEPALEHTEAHEKYFREAVNDDLNAPLALATLQDALVAKNMSPAEKLFLLKKFDEVLGLGLERPMQLEVAPEAVEKAKEYEKLRNNKQFVNSDSLRKEIESIHFEGLGVVVRDTKNGTMLIPKFFD